MTDRNEEYLDAALSGLAADMARGAPQPGDTLVARVLDDAQAEAWVTAAVEELAADAVANTPRPGPDLVARVLADAAAIAPPQAEQAPGTEPARGGFSLADFLFGWRSSAVAAMAIALVTGIGIGMQLEEGDLPLTEPVQQGNVFAMDGGLLPEEFL
ncbi:MAG: hypothetical protein AAGJ28_18010 [Pseudomonadota bacterium]